MSSTNSFHPCLPQDLINKLVESDPSFTSMIFRPQREKFRLEVLAVDRAVVHREVVVEQEQIQPPLPNRGLAQLTSRLFCFRPGDGKNFLHCAISRGDELLAYELIRMGITIDAPDSAGVTPLLFALLYIYYIYWVHDAINNPTTPGPSPRSNGTDTLHIDRLVRITILLIEQHADVNASAFSITPLTLAVVAGHWPLVELLLCHGAIPMPPTSIELASPANRAHFASLIDRVQPLNPRPSRPCPCWSGKLLSEFHSASAQPYPDHFLCCCGKRKTYGACCSKRGLNIQEKWDEESATIVRIQAPSTPWPTVAPEIEPFVADGWGIAQGVAARLQDTIPNTPKDRYDFFFKLLTKFGQENDVDPSFWYALRQAYILPQPWKNKTSSLEGKRNMDDWNTAVDSYILEGSDIRPAIEIEAKAKIDSCGGPLYKRCEAEECPHVETSVTVKMKLCSGCKLIVYCGQECQSKDWKRHKKDCGPKTHRVQLLPSQSILLEAMEIRLAAIAIQARAGCFGEGENLWATSSESTLLRSP